MLFMIIETFRPGSLDAVRARFQSRGRLIPDGRGIAYVSSWMTSDGSRCYQLMEAPTRHALDSWIAAWSDLVEFEVIEVQTSADFWAKR